MKDNGNPEIEKWVQEALDTGFSHACALDVSTVKLLPEVRKMCEMNTCGAYGKNWTCPPACGSMEECTERVRKYQHGILMQTVGKVEDWMDFEGMMRVEKEHKQHFMAYVRKIREAIPDILPAGAGGCRICETCTYPDEPCRHPDLAYPSMEAYGMDVNQTCAANGLKYNYGQNTIAYSACVFLP